MRPHCECQVPWKLTLDSFQVLAHGREICITRGAAQNRVGTHENNSKSSILIRITADEQPYGPEPLLTFGGG